MSETTFKNTTVKLNDTGFSKYSALAADAVCDIKSRAGLVFCPKIKSKISTHFLIWQKKPVLTSTQTLQF